MTTEEVLQKVNDYCSEKSYTSETLTDEFKSQFADFFVKKNGESSIDDELRKKSRLMKQRLLITSVNWMS